MGKGRKFYHKNEVKSIKCEKVEEDIAIWLWHAQKWNRLRKEQKLFASTVFYYPIQCSDSFM